MRVPSRRQRYGTAVWTYLADVAPQPTVTPGTVVVATVCVTVVVAAVAAASASHSAAQAAISAPSW
jgi:hypothetical protein